MKDYNLNLKCSALFKQNACSLKKSLVSKLRLIFFELQITVYLKLTIQSLIINAGAYYVIMYRCEQCIMWMNHYFTSCKTYEEYYI